MRLPPFVLEAPTTVEEASGLLERYGDEAALYGGGTELLLLMKLGFAEPRRLVDVKGIRELGGLRVEDGRLVIGATVTHRELERSPLVRERWPALAEMERSVANVRVRSAGTLGGNLCFGDPHSDPATFLLAAEADVVARSGGARPRTIPLAAFVRGPYQTALEPGELLLAVRVPELPEGAAMAHRKLAFHERPAITVSCLVRLERGAVAEGRIAVGSVGPLPERAQRAEELLRGASLERPEALAASAEAAAAEVSPVEDGHGSVEYKRQLVRVLVGRALRDALARAR